MAKITIKTKDRVIRQIVEPGTLVGDAVLGAGVLFDRPCAGRGICGKCKMHIEGPLSEPEDVELERLSKDELARGYRLACQANIEGDVTITVSRGAISTDKIFRAEVDLEDLEGPLGLAIDLGSTTVGAFLVTLNDGRVHAGNAVLNHQTSVGAEIISRLLAADRDSDKLKDLAIKSIRESIAGLQLPRDVLSRVERAVVVGNSAMHHMALGLPVKRLMLSPFEPVSLEDHEVKAELLDSGLSKKCKVRFPRVIGGFVGSDALACLEYFGFESGKVPTVALDLGTNGEVMVSDGNRIVVASTAAGPAFEGVNISCGMRALPGAITGMHISKSGELDFETIAGASPRGIAGSGLLSIVSEFIRPGLIDISGRVVSNHSRLAGMLSTENDIQRINLAPGIYLSQTDIRELQKAKAAIRAAADVLLTRLGLAASDLGRVILTGSFGGKLKVDDTLALGVLPALPAGLVQSISNGAGLGAAMMLNDEAFERANALASKVEHVELNADPEFMDCYIESMQLQ